MFYVLNLNLFVDEYENRKHLYSKAAKLFLKGFVAQT